MRTLKEIGEQMNAQDHRSTFMPLFIVVADEKVYGMESGYQDGRERKEEVDGDDLCEECQKIDAAGVDLPDECESCNGECFLYYRLQRDVPQLDHGVFLTGQECDRYIDSRSYAMKKGAHSYGISAFRSNEMQVVLEHLSTIGGDGTPHRNYTV